MPGSGEQFSPRLPVGSSIGVVVMYTEDEPSLGHRRILVLFQSSGDGQIPHRLISVTGKGARPVHVGAGEGIVDAAVARCEYLPVTPVALLPWEPSDKTSARIGEEGSDDSQTSFRSFLK